jgi:hypothetical protein
MKVGDMVKFSEAHYKDSPGHEYVKDWIGVVVESRVSTLSLDEIVIMWSIHGGSHISTYDEEWWNKLDYEPLEVIYEQIDSDEPPHHLEQIGGINEMGSQES